MVPTLSKDKVMRSLRSESPINNHEIKLREVKATNVTLNTELHLLEQSMIEAEEESTHISTRPGGYKIQPEVQHASRSDRRQTPKVWL